MSDDAWFVDTFIPRLLKCLDDGDARARLVLFRDARKNRPGLELHLYGIEALLPSIDKKEGALKMAKELIEKLKPATYISAEKMVAAAGGVIGVDDSEDKAVETSKK